MSAGGWGRRSRAALIALVVLVPVSIGAALSVDAVDYWNSAPRTATTVPPGEVARFAGAELRVLESWTATADSARGIEYGVPEGTALVSVVFELDASHASEDFVCDTKLLQLRGDRRWTSSLGGGTDYWPGSALPDDLSDELPSGCSFAETPFPFEKVFLIPDDAAGDVVVEVISAPELPRVFHLVLE